MNAPRPIHKSAGSSSPERAELESANIAHHLVRMARDRPFAPALMVPAGRDLRGRMRHVHWTYRELDQHSDRLARGLVSIGIGPGVRTVLMVKPSLELFALVFALFKAGAPLVMVDPGLGRSSLGECLRRAEPRAFIGIPLAHAARAALGWGKDTIEHHVTVAPSWARPTALARRAWTIDDLRRAGERSRGPAMQKVSESDLAAILFTSGSTGAPKGARYEHRTFAAQVEAIRSMYGITPGEIDLPTFPLFALFDPALGMSSVIPDMDATRPAQVNPRNVVEAINGFGVTNMFGSPALLEAVGRWGASRGITLPTLKRVISAGAPVAPRILERFAQLLPSDGMIHTPYGATEALPVASISHREVLGETRARTALGEGTCVGKPVGSAKVDIIRITDEPIASWDPTLPVRAGAIGEIVVRGPQVTPAYEGAPEATALAKIETPEGIAHRMGDVGWLDERGRLWFCGRKSHRVVLGDGTVLFTDPCEGPFNAHAAVRRSALVGATVAGSVVPVMCIEPWDWVEGSRAEQLVSALRAIAIKHERTRRIERVLLHRAFPVDVRHNAKIRREELAIWASGVLSAE